MSRAYISAFDRLDLGRYGGGAQCFPGACSAPRADVRTAAGWPAAPHMTVGAGGGYVAIYLTAEALIYAGPAADAATYDARAGAYPAGWWPMAVQPADVVLVRDLGAAQ